MWPTYPQVFKQPAQSITSDERHHRENGSNRQVLAQRYLQTEPGEDKAESRHEVGRESRGRFDAVYPFALHTDHHLRTVVALLHPDDGIDNLVDRVAVRG